MIKRTMSAAFLNEVANHPEVRPFLGGQAGAADLSPLDFTEVVTNPDVFALETEGGGWLFCPLLPGVYELHTLFLPGSLRGAHFMRTIREAFRFMFAKTDCLEIVTKCPDDNPGARFASSALGFRERFRRDDAWAPGVGVSFRVFSIDEWFVRDVECLAAGRAFHEMLSRAKAEVGSALPAHPDDETHDRAVGAAALMVQAGHVAKGVAFYNRWAIFAGYATIGELPGGLVDVQDAIVQVREGQMEVLLCRQQLHLAPRVLADL